VSQLMRVALVGTGGWGRQHVRVLATHPQVDFVAVAGRTVERTQARATEYGVRAYTCGPDMLERERPDLVCVCLPNEEHFAPTLQFIHAGVPLLVEMPLVIDLDEADTLLSEAEARGLFFGINFNHRYAMPVRLAAEAVARGRLGELAFATWRFDGEAGTSRHPDANLIETQCHGFDMLEHLCGLIESVMAQTTGRPGASHSIVVIALAFANGAVGPLVGTYDSSYTYASTHVLEVNGTRGRLIIEDTVRRYTYSRAGSETSEVWQAGYFNDAERSFHHTFDRHFDAVLRSFVAGAEPPVHTRAGLRTLQLAHAAVASSAAGVRVPTPVIPSHLLRDHRDLENAP
jgi:myo-inositol 2-dehydrogenase / D-chiro-inositol 1-dehydrogenase